jgi:hypothetical protein
MAHIDMSLLSIECFMNDGTLDAMELDKLVSLAEADGKFTQGDRWGRQMGTPIN